MIKPLILFFAVLASFSVGCFVALIIRYPKVKKRHPKQIPKNVPKHETNDNSTENTRQNEKSPLSKIDKSCSYTEFSSELDGTDKSSIIKKNMKTQDKKYRKTKQGG